MSTKIQFAEDAFKIKSSDNVNVIGFELAKSADLSSVSKLRLHTDSEKQSVDLTSGTNKVALTNDATNARVEVISTASETTSKAEIYTTSNGPVADFKYGNDEVLIEADGSKVTAKNNNARTIVSYNGITVPYKYNYVGSFRARVTNEETINAFDKEMIDDDDFENQKTIVPSSYAVKKFVSEQSSLAPFSFVVDEPDEDGNPVFRLRYTDPETKIETDRIFGPINSSETWETITTKTKISGQELKTLINNKIEEASLKKSHPLNADVKILIKNYQVTSTSNSGEIVYENGNWVYGPDPEYPDDPAEWHIENQTYHVSNVTIEFRKCDFSKNSADTEATDILADLFKRKLITATQTYEGDQMTLETLPNVINRFKLVFTNCIFPSSKLECQRMFQLLRAVHISVTGFPTSVSVKNANEMFDRALFSFTGSSNESITGFENVQFRPTNGNYLFRGIDLSYTETLRLLNINFMSGQVSNFVGMFDECWYRGNEDVPASMTASNLHYIETNIKPSYILPGAKLSFPVQSGIYESQDRFIISCEQQSNTYLTELHSVFGHYNVSNPGSLANFQVPYCFPDNFLSNSGDYDYSWTLFMLRIDVNSNASNLPNTIQFNLEDFDSQQPTGVTLTLTKVDGELESGSGKTSYLLILEEEIANNLGYEESMTGPTGHIRSSLAEVTSLDVYFIGISNIEGYSI